MLNAPSTLKKLVTSTKLALEFENTPALNCRLLVVALYLNSKFSERNLPLLLGSNRSSSRSDNVRPPIYAASM